VFCGSFHSDCRKLNGEISRGPRTGRIFQRFFFFSFSFFLSLFLKSARARTSAFADGFIVSHGWRLSHSFPV